MVYENIGAVSELFGGVETGGTTCVAALATPAGEIVARCELPTREPEVTLAAIIDFFGAYERPRAIGIGAFGPVDLDRDSAGWGHVTTTPKPGWRGANVGPRIRDALGVPVIFDNDVGAAAYGEYVWGAGVGRGSVAYLTVGTGIGGGYVLEGRPWHGALQPEVGHIRVPRLPGDDYGGCCPIHGDCWEGLAAAPALAARYGVEPSELDDDHAAWELESAYLASGILAISMIVSPERLILGGGVGRRPGMLARIRRQLVALNGGYLLGPLSAAGIEDYLVAPALGADAGVLGAVALARDAPSLGAPAGSARSVR